MEDRGAPAPPGRWLPVVAVVLVVATMAAYAPVLGNDFEGAG